MVHLFAELSSAIIHESSFVKDSYRQQPAHFLELLHCTVTMNVRCFGVQPGDKLPVFDWIEIMLVLDHNELVSVSRFSESCQVFVGHIVQVKSGNSCTHGTFLVCAMFDGRDHHLTFEDP